MPILLNPQAYSTVALVIHELVTNAAKYGALRDAGQISIQWSRTSTGDLELLWSESDGPLVSPPTRQGFGATIIARSVPYDLGGEAVLDYRPEGLRARFVIPGRHVTEVEEIKGPTTRCDDLPDTSLQSVSSTLLAGKRVMLVEDNLIIALDADDILRRLGASEVVAEGTVVGALAAIKANAPDLAILDINLGDHNSFAIADHLDDSGIPFLFATGYGEQAKLPERHRARIVLQKPYTLQMMARGIPEILGASVD